MVFFFVCLLFAVGIPTFTHTQLGYKPVFNLQPYNYGKSTGK